MRASLLILLLFTFLPGWAQSQETSSSVPSTEKKSPDSLEELNLILQQKLDEEGDPAFGARQETNWAAQILRTLVVLLFLIGVFYVIYKAWLFRKNLPDHKSHSIKVFVSHPLSANKSLQIVQVGGRLLLLGVTDSNISLLAEISDKHRMDQILLDAEKDANNPPPDFLLELSTSVRKGIKSFLKPSMTPEPPPPEDFESMRSKSTGRIRKMRSERNLFSEDGEDK